MKYYKTSLIKKGSDFKEIYKSKNKPVITNVTITLITFESKRLIFKIDQLKDLKVDFCYKLEGGE